MLEILNIRRKVGKRIRDKDSKIIMRIQEISIIERIDTIIVMDIIKSIV